MFSPGFRQYSDEILLIGRELSNCVHEGADLWRRNPIGNPQWGASRILTMRISPVRARADTGGLFLGSDAAIADRYEQVRRDSGSTNSWHVVSVFKRRARLGWARIRQRVPADMGTQLNDLLRPRTADSGSRGLARGSAANFSSTWRQARNLVKGSRSPRCRFRWELRQIGST